MLLRRISAVSQCLARLGSNSKRNTLLHPGLSFIVSRCQNVSSSGDPAQPAVKPTAGQYRDTVLLPRSEFPMKLTGQKLLERELEIQRVRTLHKNCVCLQHKR